MDSWKKIITSTLSFDVNTDAVTKKNLQRMSFTQWPFYIKAVLYRG